MSNNLWDTVEKEILPFVDKPARYVGGEWNSIVKSHENRTSVALIYPDAYEVGISNLGLRILYHILNQHDDFVCERAYAPWLDMEQFLRDKDIPLFSLETHSPLGGFDALGFSFQYELVYTNFLNILDLSAIPFRSVDRDERHPFILAGGPAVFNIEPIAPFLDAVCIGDGESRIIRMMEVIAQGKKAGQSRRSILDQLAEIDGVYVPSLYGEQPAGTYVLAQGKQVCRYIEPEIEPLDFPVAQILPIHRAVQDRAVIEIARGCAGGCRFCQAGTVYRPVRERNADTILRLAREAVISTGYREFSLISLSVSDYSGLTELIQALDAQFSPHGISFSLPSLRLDSFTLELAERVREIRKSGLTFAVEGGTQPIRNAINKGVTQEELFRVIDIAQSLGWKSVKLYFMIGLPHTHDKDEMGGIIELVSALHRTFPRMAATVSVAVFVPKPHTPFERAPQMSPEQADEEFHRLIAAFRKNRKINIRLNNPQVSYIEGIFSRGGRELAPAVESAFRKGARFDGWSDQFQPELWAEVFRENSVDPASYHRGQEAQAPLPWDIISSGVKSEFLAEENRKGEEGQLTADCDTACSACGVCDFREIRPSPAAKDASPVIDEGFLPAVRIEPPESVSYIRFQLSRRGAYKYQSQLDSDENLVRAMIRADIPVSFTRGFNPHVRLEMGWAIPVGYESDCEIGQVEIRGAISAEQFVQSLNRVLPPDIRIVDARVYSQGHRLNRRAKRQWVKFVADAPGDEEFIRETYSRNRVYQKVTPQKRTTLNLDDYLTEWRIEDKRLIAVYLQEDGGARIQDIIAGLTGKDARQAVALRPRILYRYIEQDGQHIGVLDA